jgi:ribosome-associated toxin RatA of RatAB toxin-antitoxin module
MTLKQSKHRRAALTAWIDARRVLAMLALVVIDAAAAAADVSVNVRRADDSVFIEASAMLDASPATAWRVLTDYDRYAEFIPGLRSSHVVARDGTRLTVAQSGEAAFWLLRMPLDITYEVTEFPPYRLESNAKASPLRTLDSRYVLTPSASGVRLDYAGRLAPRSAIFGRIEQHAVRQSIVREFQALADEIERSSASGPPR